MNKIIIVGHPQSGYQEVEALLNACGMKHARPSRRDGFTPEEIGATLCKAHKAQSLQQLGVDESIQQLEVSPVWHGMALDLMLGNIDQDLWGWADPQSIYLLDYWKTLDPKITFILVYDAPHTLLTADRGQLDLSQDTLQRHAHAWQSYNTALLHFYYRNPDRCLLVHAGQVRQSVHRYLQQVQSRIDTPLLQASQLQAATEGQASLALAQSTREADFGKELTHARNAAEVSRAIEIGGATQYQANSTTKIADDDALRQFLAEAIINHYPRTLQLYEELQSAANLPVVTPASRGVNPLQAWRGMVALSTAAHELAFQAKEQQAQAQQLIAQAQAEGQALSKQLLTAISQGKEQRQEAEMALSQLHQVQEELERHYLENQQLKRQAPTKIEQTQTNKEFQQENELLLAQLHQVQEELERYYLENRALKANPSSISSKASPKQAHYGAAERVKRQLSYRLGAVIIARSRSVGGVLTMPLALLKEAQQFKREKLQRGVQKLPPISSYRDAHEAERVRQHLSFRLGATLLAHAGSPVGWVKLPWMLSREVKAFRNSKRA